ncbi:MAG: hypothetical protein WCF65_06845 [Parachlamydiaceae bacterium]
MIMKTNVVPLSALAHARSGDKGSSANIGVIAYTQEGYKLLEKYLSEDSVALFFNQLSPYAVKRYALPNLLAFNFVLKGVLKGGGSCSLRTDAQGKTLGQAILEMPIGENNESQSD